ncbi:MAG: hypothetical protein JW852_05175 [Spirochaetales bacterium]|nr:hypothetical protein [Spirochaetales bacterium]
MDPLDKKSISIIHHHLEPGGVTEVVGLSVRAMAAFLPGIAEIRLVSGHSGGAETLAGQLKTACARLGVTVTLDIVPEIEYLPADATPGDKANELADAIKTKLLRICSGTVWMVHNYHLGKNPVFTRAIFEIARDRRDEKICLYIHDFPECSRYENLSFLQSFFPESPYPVTPNVRYAVINSRDRDYLVSAGIPDSMVFLLNNPVPAAELPGGNDEELRAKLESNLTEEFPAYIPGAPLLLYPVRTIRRKNALELGLICAASPLPVNLVVTLPGTSSTEKDYSDKVCAAFAGGLIPGLWGIGTRLKDAGLSFPNLISIADMICSSSVQEGFGYLFVNAVKWRIPLFARYLEVLDGIVSLFDDHPSYFYRSARIPASPGQITALRDAYKEKARRLVTVAGPEIVESITEQFSDIIDGDTVDFSFLPVDWQVKTLERIRGDAAYRNSVRELNAELYRALEKLRPDAGRSRKGAVVQGHTQEPDWPFTFERYAATVKSIIDSFELPSGPAPDGRPDVQAHLIRRFADIGYLRLLYAN